MKHTAAISAWPACRCCRYLVTLVTSHAERVPALRDHRVGAADGPSATIKATTGAAIAFQHAVLVGGPKAPRTRVGESSRRAAFAFSAPKSKSGRASVFSAMLVNNFGISPNPSPRLAACGLSGRRGGGHASLFPTCGGRECPLHSCRKMPVRAVGVDDSLSKRRIRAFDASAGLARPTLPFHAFWRETSSAQHPTVFGPRGRSDSPVPSREKARPGDPITAVHAPPRPLTNCSPNQRAEARVSPPPPPSAAAERPQPR